MKKIILRNKKYTLDDIYLFSKKHKYHFSISKEAEQKVLESRALVDSKIMQDNPVYGINTGFGKLSTIKIQNMDIAKLQKNLILSHSVGVGNYIPDRIVRIILLLKIISFIKGNSGVSLALIKQMLIFLNNDCLPLIPSKGSVGASGDLAPLSHMTLSFIGIGQVKYKNKIISSKLALKKLDIKPIELKSKEGLALINGTQFSTAYGVYSLKKAHDLFKMSDLVSAMTIEALKGSKKPFLNYVNAVKPYEGQLDVCKNISLILNDSEIMESHKNCDRVQDMYSLRCIPQVHGSSRDLLYFAKKQINVEINSVSDNPLVFINEKEIVSAGQFHAEAMAHSLDICAMGVCSISNISERRIFALLKGDYGLPEFLINNPGLNSGFMMLQVTAAALASENKVLSNPSSTDSIPTCSDQEDYVSMAPYSGRKLLNSVNNLRAILSIELLAACQGVDFRDGLKPSKILNILHKLVRNNIKFLNQDRLLKNDLDKMIELMDGELLAGIESEINII
ncbi:MAG: histidine ammonia-lyase [Candidatus Marinimicrobia bacterium]|nr:histidine ammonia-lyase [Candidatus Neomarinimicrobiota bacterium]|tara:strand:- start:36369 stop:37892 length:1524 start_codon:yes stop_codon:yes gene_type:complete